MFIPDPNFFHPGSASKCLSILTQNIASKLSELWSWLFIPDPYHESWYFTHPGSGIQGSKRPRIRIRRTAFYSVHSLKLRKYTAAIYQSDLNRIISETYWAPRRIYGCEDVIRQSFHLDANFGWEANIKIRVCYSCTVKSSNVVIVFAQNNFFLHNLWRLPHVFFMRAGV